MRFNHPADLARAVHALADDLAALPPFDLLPDLVVSFGIQALAGGGVQVERVAAVDALLFALFGVDGALERGPDGSWRYASPAAAGEHHTGMRVSVSTPVAAPVARLAVAA
ncbi:hypothetical protein [Dactylosporangium sp. CA-092794]|uniref:hypothetical protein n=1 Tax=Dactylosporangium sp. CA-092794 TaxID=3239929 RepID=UPI003D906129